MQTGDEQTNQVVDHDWALHLIDVDNASQGHSDKKQYIKDCKDNIRLMLEYSALDGLSISCLKYPNMDS